MDQTQDLNTILSAWNTPAFLGVCEACDGLFLIPQEALPATQTRCPYCFMGKLSPVESNAEAAQALASVLRSPELVAPFSLPASRLSQKLAEFALGVRLAPQDLQPDRLQARLRRLYLPVWLVDGKVQANWQVEAGFDYQVVSHQEAFAEGAGWRTREVNETRQRWEPRAGRMARSYQNITAPALEAHTALFGSLGQYATEQAQPYTAQAAFSQPPASLALPPGAVATAIAYAVHLPNRVEEDAWPDALPRFQAQAAEEVRQACAADHVREFRWAPQFPSRNWTLMLLPAYTTFYLDDENRPQRVLVNGQTGQLSGVRRASPQRARTIAATILMAAMLIFLLSACVAVIAAFNPLLLVVAGVGLFIALAVAACAIIPWAIVWSTNKDA